MYLLLLIALGLVIAVYDWRFRRIPNILVLLYVAVRILFLIIKFNYIIFIESLIGMAFAFLIFLIPKLLKMTIGWGDIKYSAAIGFALGFPNYVCSMIICLICSVIYLLFRKYAMKKDIKEYPLPLGSFMSIGSILILTVNIIL